MKTTMRGVLLNVEDECRQQLDRLMRKYGFMVRYAFNRPLESGIVTGELERLLAAETNLPLRYAKDAVAEANQLIASQKALVKEQSSLAPGELSRLTCSSVYKLLSGDRPRRVRSDRRIHCVG